MLVTYQIKALGLVNINLSTKNFFFEILGPEKAQGRGGSWKGKVKNRFFTHMARFAQGMQNVILHIYFMFKLHIIPTLNYLPGRIYKETTCSLICPRKPPYRRTCQCYLR